MEVKVLWKVMISWPDRASEAADALERHIEAAADACPDLIDEGRGCGFGQRDLDFTFETRASAERVVSEAEAVLHLLPDLTVRVVEVGFELEG